MWSEYVREIIHAHFCRAQASEAPQASEASDFKPQCKLLDDTYQRRSVNCVETQLIHCFLILHH